MPMRPPDLMIYLRADLPKLTRQIRKRGRDFEQAISPDYLASLNNLYETFAQSYSAGELLIIDVNDLDYANQPADLAHVIGLIDAQLAVKA